MGNVFINYQPPYELTPLFYFKSENSFTFSVYNNTPSWDGIIEYNNGNDWTIWDGSTLTANLINDNYYLFLRGSNNTTLTGLTYYGTRVGRFSFTGEPTIHTYGDICTLFNYRDFDIIQPQSYCCCRLFLGCTQLLSGPSLSLKYLSEYCYKDLFADCSSLIIAPELPVMVLTPHCYEGLFWKCTSLITPPKLPAIILEEDSYNGIFGYCTSLQALPSITITAGKATSMRTMFSNCNQIKFFETLQENISLNPYIIIKTTDNNITFTRGFTGTSGYFTGNPVTNTTYYTNMSIIS